MFLERDSYLVLIRLCYIFILAFFLLPLLGTSLTSSLFLLLEKSRWYWVTGRIGGGDTTTNQKKTFFFKLYYLLEMFLPNECVNNWKLIKLGENTKFSCYTFMSRIRRLKTAEGQWGEHCTVASSCSPCFWASLYPNQ